MEIILIAAIGKNRELGKKGDLIWRIPEDLKHFKEATKGNAVVMGRKTYESIGKPLPKRVNIIVTRDTEYHQEGCVVAHSLKDAIKVAENTGVEKIYIIGGGEIYKQALPLTNKLNLTLIDAEDSEVDVFFPEFEDEFKVVSEKEPQEEGGVSYQWVMYERK